jgi:uncharacterized membrane protein
MIYSKIVSTAEQFLKYLLLFVEFSLFFFLYLYSLNRKSVEHEEEIKALLSTRPEEEENEQEMEIEGKQLNTGNVLSSPMKGKNAHLLKYKLVRSKDSIPLSIGDRILYHQKVNNDHFLFI